MSAFVILAAGRGTRIGRVGASLHKCLAPLDGRAVLSHLFELRPPDSRVIVCVGHRADQVREYVKLAHPNLDVQFIDVDGWDAPGGGPGHSLLAARGVVGDDSMVFTSCDTLWTRDDELWENPYSWAAVAPVPAGTPPTRWCRIAIRNGHAFDILDKRPGSMDALAYVGMSQIADNDIATFWLGVEHGTLHDGERQVSGGLEMLMTQGRLGTRRITWTDVGDEASYRRAVAEYSGYDWTKTDEATYVLPNEGRVVKFFDDANVVPQRRRRAETLKGCVPDVIDNGVQMLAYEYVQGVTMYDFLEQPARQDLEWTRRLLEWAERNVWDVMGDWDESMFAAACMKFYRDKTLERVAMLPRDLQGMCLDIVSRVDWDVLCKNGVPSRWHGDFNFGNIIVTTDGFVGIDWRQDFAGLPYGDKRYDYAKLLAGCYVHWGRARRGDFRRWDQQDELIDVILEHTERHAIIAARDVKIIGALSLLNSAPLHAAPLDEVLVARGCAWLEDILR